MKFYDWITGKYLGWRGDAFGRERTVTQFAKYLGLGQQVVASWMVPNGKVPKSQKSINALVNRFGLEVYDVLGLDGPEEDPLFERVNYLLAQMTEEQREEALKLLEKICEQQRREKLAEG